MPLTFASHLPFCLLCQVGHPHDSFAPHGALYRKPRFLPFKGGNSEVQGDEEAKGGTAAGNLGSELVVLIGALCWGPHS